MLIVAIFLIVAIGLAHSYLGEKYIFARLLREPLPKLFGSDQFTKRTLRFAWHITTIAWLGIAALVLLLYVGEASDSNLLIAIAATFAATGITALLASRGKHLSWVVFGAIAAVCFASSSIV